MKVMMVITGMQSGGAERVMATLCNELALRHQIRLLSMKEAVSDYSLNEQIDFIGGNVQNQSAIKSVLFTKHQIDEWKPDVILSFMTKSNIIALLAAKVSKHRVPVVIAERANPYYAKPVFKVIRRFLYPSASGCVFQTEQAKEYYKKILKCDSVVLRNPLNPDFNVKPYEGKRTQRIVTMGRLSPEKNQKLLIEAFSKIADKFPAYNVEIFGEGPMRGELEQCIEGYGLSNRIFLMGRKDNVQQYIADAEIFVLPSNSEGMPNALIEAMALGLTCIATDCPIGGSAVIIQHEQNGLLIPMNDVKGLTNALEELLNDKIYARKLGAVACKVSEDFGATKVCREWEAFLCEIAQYTD